MIWKNKTNSEYQTELICSNKTRLTYINIYRHIDPQNHLYQIWWHSLKTFTKYAPEEYTNSRTRISHVADVNVLYVINFSNSLTLCLVILRPDIWTKLSIWSAASVKNHQSVLDVNHPQYADENAGVLWGEWAVSLIPTVVITLLLSS